MHKMPMKPSSW